MVGALFVIKSLNVRKLNGFLTTKAKTHIVRLRKAKGFLSNKTPTIIEKDVDDDTAYRDTACKLTTNATCGGTGIHNIIIIIIIIIIVNITMIIIIIISSSTFVVVLLLSVLWYSKGH